MTTNDARPRVSIVIPVYNEELILFGAVEQLLEKMKRFDFTYELILTENGSKDKTVAIAQDLASRHECLRVLHSDEPNYGKALKRGILEAKGEFVVCDEIDLCDTDFYRRALELLFSGRAEMVVGSKALAESNDNRPVMRRVATGVLNGMLRVATGFTGTDTHGLKAFRREALLSVVNDCQLERDLFTSEFVIRAERAKFTVKEIPLELREIRAPSVNLYKRVPKVLKDMARLVYLIRIKG